MDLLDLVIVVILVLGGWSGYRMGLIRQLTRLFGVVASYLLAVWLQPYVSPIIASLHLFPKQSGLLQLFLGNIDSAVAFAVVFLVAFLLLRYGVGLVDTLFRLPVLSTINRLAGLIAGLIVAAVFIYVASLVAHYLPSPQVQSLLADSAIIQWLASHGIQQIVNHSLHG